MLATLFIRNIAMKTRTLFITTILSAGLVLSIAACSNNADTITGHNAVTVNHPAADTAGENARDVAEDFVGHINYARIALAKNKGNRAEQHVAEARNLLAQLQNTTVEERRVERIESGRVVYNTTNDYKYHYFPITTGPLEIKKMSHGPVWAKNDLAVTDADIVYLTVDLNGNNAAKRLNEAEADIKAGHLKAADNQLAQLTDEVVTVDEQTSVPLDKARDNIRLARNFVSSGNYTGARYALKHADDALDEMQNDNTYQTHRTAIITMRKEVKHLQVAIAAKDPGLAHKAVAKLDKWWSQLKDWSNS